MKENRQINIISSIALCALYCCMFGKPALALGTYTEVKFGIANLPLLVQVLTFVASAALAVWGLFSYFKKPNDKSNIADNQENLKKKSMKAKIILLVALCFFIFSLLGPTVISAINNTLHPPQRGPLKYNGPNFSVIK